MQIWTHKIDGLTESDFILAAAADQLYTDLTGAFAAAVKIVRAFGPTT